MLRSITRAASIWALTLGLASAKVQYGGVNIAGFDFGCTIDGTCDTSDVVPPLREYKGQDGAAQMQHFVTNNRLNAFRLPVGWQYLVDQPGSPLIPEHIEAFDALVQACLATDSLCIIDIHNYARWDKLIVGQGGPSDEQFASLWSQLATKYARSPNVAMGIVNEPHDIPSITRWAQTCQTVVNAIRKAGAAENLIMLPGNGYTNAADFVSSGSAAALARVKDVDGTTDKLMFEVHKYLDEDNSGTHIECVSSYVDAFEDLTQWLKDNGRRALLAEVGGGPYQKSCLRDVCELLTYLNDNGDVYAGYLGWGAGSFDETYELSLSPNGTDDVPLMTECFAKVFDGGSARAPASSNVSTPDQSFSNSTLPQPAPESSGGGGNGGAVISNGNTLGGNTGSSNTGTGNTGTNGGIPSPENTSREDASSGSAGSGNAGSGNAGSGNDGSGDAGSEAAGSGNLGSGNTGSGDAGSGDAGSEDTGPKNAGSEDAGPGNTGSEKDNPGDAGSEPAGSGNSGSGNDGSGDAGSETAGSGNLGVENPGTGSGTSTGPKVDGNADSGNAGSIGSGSTTAGIPDIQKAGKAKAGTPIMESGSTGSDNMDSPNADSGNADSSDLGPDNMGPGHMGSGMTVVGNNNTSNATSSNSSTANTSSAGGMDSTGSDLVGSDTMGSDPTGSDTVGNGNGGDTQQPPPSPLPSAASSGFIRSTTSASGSMNTGTTNSGNSNEQAPSTNPGDGGMGQQDMVGGGNAQPMRSGKQRASPVDEEVVPDQTQEVEDDECEAEY